MKRSLALPIAASLLALGLSSIMGHADTNELSNQLSPEKLDMLDHAGIFTPAFKAAVHELVNNKHALEQAQEDNKKLALELPGLQNQAQQAQAKAVALRQELAKYEHPEETDFVALQSKMNDTSAKLEDRIAVAQAYVWAYPASPHESVAQQYLQQLQKKVTDQVQGEKDVEAARVAAHAKLIQRARAHDLS